MNPNDILRDVGPHVGSSYSTDGAGHYEASFGGGGGVTIETIFDNPGATHIPRVALSPEEWDRLVAWVGWRRKDI